MDRFRRTLQQFYSIKRCLRTVTPVTFCKPLAVEKENLIHFHFPPYPIARNVQRGNHDKIAGPAHCARNMGTSRRGKARRPSTVAAAPAPGRMAFSVNEAAFALHCSPNTVWKMIHDGELNSFKLGRRRLISASHLEVFINNGGKKSK